MVSVTHKFRSTLDDDGDTSLIQPSNWNDEHSISGSFSFALNVYTPEDAGYVPNRGDDATSYIQAILTDGNICRLNSGKEYTITSRLVINVAGSGIVSDGTGLLIMSDASGAFDNTDATAGTRYGANACGIYATSMARPIVQGIRIRYGVSTSAGTDDRYVKALYFTGCTDIVCNDNEAWNFSKALGVFAFADCTRGTINNNHIHDCTTNSATTGQITGIETDNDGSVGCTALQICHNRIHDLTVGATFLAISANNYQTDGINIAGIGHVGHHLVIANNWIYNVGEGIDCFGADCTIADNVIRKCYLYGLKFIHGGSRNVATGNHISDCGLGGITIVGSSASGAIDTSGNLIANNKIYNIDPDGTQAANETFGINLAGGALTYVPTFNRIVNNDIDLGTHGKRGITALTGSGNNNTVRNNHVRNWDTSYSKYLFQDTVVVSSFEDGNSTSIKILAADGTGTNGTSAQPWFPSGGALTVELGTYKVQGMLWVTCGSTSRTVSMSIGGTATATCLIEYQAQVAAADTTQTTQNSTLVDTVSATQCIGASTGTSFWVNAKGTIRVTVAGTIIPQFTFSADPTGTIAPKKGTFFEAVRVSSSATFVTNGLWA